MADPTFTEFQRKARPLLEMLTSRALAEGCRLEDLCAYAQGRSEDLDRFRAAVVPFEDLDRFPEEIAEIHRANHADNPSGTIGVVFVLDTQWVYGVLFPTEEERHDAATVDSSPTPHRVSNELLKFQSQTYSQLSEFIAKSCLGVALNPAEAIWVVDGNDDASITMFHPRERLEDFLKACHGPQADDMVQALEKRAAPGSVVVLYLLQDWAVAHVTLPPAYSPGGTA